MLLIVLCHSPPIPQVTMLVCGRGRMWGESEFWECDWREIVLVTVRDREVTHRGHT